MKTGLCDRERDLQEEEDTQDRCLRGLDPVQRNRSSTEKGGERYSHPRPKGRRECQDVGGSSHLASSRETSFAESELEAKMVRQVNGPKVRYLGGRLLSQVVS